MGFEIPVDIDYFEHPKTIHLVTLLGPRADVFPLRLWGWAAKYAKDGVIRVEQAVVEVALGWPRPHGGLFTALATAGFLHADKVTIHGWQERIGRAIALYEAKKAKQRQRYAAEKGILPEEFRTPSGHSGEDRIEEDRRGGRTAASQPQTPPVSASPKRGEEASALERVRAKAQEVGLTAASKGQMDAHLASWLRAHGEKRVLDLLAKPEAEGKDVFVISKLFARNGAFTQPKVAGPQCAKCGGRGVVQVPNGHRLARPGETAMAPCDCTMAKGTK